MGGATLRFYTLFPLLLPRSSSFRLLRRFATHPHLFLSPPPSPSLFLPPLQCSQQQHQQLHSQPLNWEEEETHYSIQKSSNNRPVSVHPWPEWLEFVNLVSRSGYCSGSVINDDGAVDGFVEQLDNDFLRAANGCLNFARHHPNLLWSLSREDIEVVIDSGSLKDDSGATRRMKFFLGSGINDVLESDKPTTVDLMSYLLSCARMAILSSESMPVNRRVESSVRKLFGELAKTRGISSESVVPVKKQFPERYNQTPRSIGTNIEMKRGDWICPRCSFMNFAKNSKCLQCEEPLPTKQLTGREWECPQCNFFNFGRNVACLRCDCKNPFGNPPQSPNFDSGLAAVSFSVEGNMGEGLAGTEEKHQSWFTKITQLEKSSDMSNDVAEEEFDVSTRVFGIDRISNGDHLQTPGADRNINVKISQCIDEALGEASSSQRMTNDTSNLSGNSTGVYPSLTSSSARYGHLSEEKFEVENGERKKIEKSERWFNEVAELHDAKDLPSAVSDEDFPDMMPIRKGENRFVISKKKDRSLTSPMYKRRMAMEQTANNNYVPFVPFPPGHFSTDKPKERSDSTHATSNSGSVSSDTGGVGKGKEDGVRNQVYDSSNNLDQTSKSSDSQFTSASSPSSENQSVRDVWRGRSLEGSAVKEPDPLDMSEEAKAERWFRRVAQIKDISELSQIPDEDFPSIMPMRKGVNRFVVSKRKTPLERRLTSSQYRRNLPFVSSDHVKKEDDSS